MKITNRRLLSSIALTATLPPSANAFDAPAPRLEEPTAFVALAVNALISPVEEIGPDGNDGSAAKDIDNLSTAASKRLKNQSLEEVIVTAQKREQRLQDVPISIAVLGGPKLDESTGQGLTNALNSIPGVTAGEVLLGGGTMVSVRGVTAGSGTFASSSPIGYYVDSVPFGFVRSAIVPDLNAYDLDRVEVLRGPQGTLYGASAQNGVVRVLTRAANLEEFEAKLRAAVSNTRDGGENYRADMALNAPVINEKLAFRAVAGYQNLSGWIDKLNRRNANDAEIKSFRARFDARATEQLSIGVSAWMSRADYGAPSGSLENHQRNSDLDESITSDVDTFGLTLAYELPIFTIESMTGYIDYTNDSALDLTLIGLPQQRLVTNLGAKTFSEEVNVRSTHSDLWRWSIGAIYRDSEDEVYQNRSGFVAPQAWRDISESRAVYGELTRIIFDGHLELTGGVRYFEDSVRVREQSRATGVPSVLISNEADFSATSPRVVATFHPSPAMTFYASYAEGFRSGAHQTPAVQAAWPSITPPEPDNLRNYEVGAKATLWDGRATFEAAAYYIDWEDVQQQIAVEVTPGRFTSALINGDSASGAGAEVGISAEPFSGFTFGISAGWNDLTFDDPVNSGGVTLFNKGDRMNLSPEQTINGSIDYKLSLANKNLTGTISLSASYTSEQSSHALFGPTAVVATGDSILVGRIATSIEAATGWVATVFVDNVSDENGVVVKQTPPFPSDWDLRTRPRTIGLQLEHRF